MIIIDATIIIALITAIAAIFAPTITAQIQRKNTLKLKELELFYEEKLRIYKEFTNQYGKIYYSDDLNKYQDFLAAAYQALLICDTVSREQINLLTDRISKADSGTDEGVTHQVYLNSKFQDCAVALQNDLQRSR